jgi:hypothetical protein
MPGGSTSDDDTPKTIPAGTPAGQSPGGDVPPLSGPSGEGDVPFVSPEHGAAPPTEDDRPAQP